MDKVAYICYSHTDYRDIWPIFFGQTRKFIPPSMPKYFFCDKSSSLVPEDFRQVIYDGAGIYTARFGSCLDSIKEQCCLFQHEDMILYDKPDFGLLSGYARTIFDGEYSFVRLIRGDDDLDLQIARTLYEAAGRWIFTIQPTLIRTDILKNIYSGTPGNTIWEFEDNCRDFCRRNSIRGLFHFNREKKRGIYHFDSNVYPFIASAIVKGKWNLSEYGKELMPLLEEYGVDYKVRSASGGFCK